VSCCAVKNVATDASCTSDSGSPVPKLIDALFNGSIDIVGDIHGEVGSLQALMFRLGYDGTGDHPEGRRPVFVGDLVDRGPDSPGAVRLVKSLVERGKAQMVLGNHEINLLRGDRKHGNHWFYGETEHLPSKHKSNHSVVYPGNPSFQSILTDDSDRDDFLAFFRKQPLALERDGLRVVHAMWDPESIDKLRNFSGHAGEAFEYFSKVVEKKLETDLSEASKDERDMARQNEHPVTVLTTGMEVPAEKPFFTPDGKMRTLERHRWWETYDGKLGLVAIGHYWRTMPHAVDLGFSPTGPPSFEKDEEPCLLGQKRAVMCVDYSIGLRFEERGRALPEGSLGTALTALRVPEMTLHFADGRPTLEMGQPLS
jgi:hypothetical protein